VSAPLRTDEGERLTGSPEPADPERRLNILVLADREWTHPQGGGTGVELYHYVTRWAAQGHFVRVIAGSYPGAPAVRHVAPNLVVHHMGGRATVFPRTIASVLRGLGKEADVVFEVVNGITFLTPLWLRKPVVTLVNHPHRDLYTGEFGPRLGRLLCATLEERPLRHLYRKVPFITISGSARDELATFDGIPPEHVTVSYCGVESEHLHPDGDRAATPTLVYVGRLKAYKRIELLLDMVRDMPEVTLDIAGQGDHGETLEEEIAQRRLQGRVRVHGHIDEAGKAELFRRAWLHVTASASEGWSLTVMEAALCGTASAALAVGGLRESIVDGQTGVLASDPADLARQVREILDDPARRDALGDAARRRAETFTWDRTAEVTLGVIERHAAARPALSR
jgi:glycosyltransferase involved in cell wall biosynthesis